VRFALSLPNAGPPNRLVDIAAAADDSGWDAVFLWDHLELFRDLQLDLHDPWVLLGAFARVTTRALLGAQVTPIARRRIATFAKEVVTLDHLSGGRACVGVGLGFPDTEFTDFGEPADLTRRARITDEMLDVLPRLWSGEPVTYNGEHLHIDAHLRPATVQRPHPPIWIGCLWPNPRAVVRARRCNGIVPINRDGGPLDPDAFAEVVRAVGVVPAGFDFVASNGTSATPKDYEAVGATWFVESAWPAGDWLDQLDATAHRSLHGICGDGVVSGTSG
jgi:alkanesulfonate monooxygenase SsuD/methylene tetrahydromethanopterin reductase-like flavin-dependent oxidoreductase (luciferase family)